MIVDKNITESYFNENECLDVLLGVDSTESWLLTCCMLVVCAAGFLLIVGCSGMSNRVLSLGSCSRFRMDSRSSFGKNSNDRSRNDSPQFIFNHERKHTLISNSRHKRLKNNFKPSPWLEFSVQILKHCTEDSPLRMIPQRIS